MTQRGERYLTSLLLCNLSKTRRHLSKTVSLRNMAQLTSPGFGVYVSTFSRSKLAAGIIVKIER